MAMVWNVILENILINTSHNGIFANYLLNSHVLDTLFFKCLYN